MVRSSLAVVVTAAVGFCATPSAMGQTQPAPSPPAAQQPAKPPPFATTKVEGTDNVYIFRYMNHQSMFVVSDAGVIATDPIGFLRPQAVKAYIDEIRKVTNQPIK